MFLSLGLSAACSSSEAGSSGSAGSAGSAGNAGSAGSGASSGLAGSVVSEREPDPPDVAPAASLFCPAWVDAFADFMQRCACDELTIARYREWSSALCGAQGAFGGLSDAVLAGDLSYHPEAAARLFARLKSAEARCVREPFLALALDSDELYSLAGTFEGTHGLGEVCRHPVGYKGGVSDCREGVCAPDGAGAGICIALVAKGAECDAGGRSQFQASATRLCHDLRPPDSDGEYQSAFDTLACVPTAPGGSQGVCSQQLVDGSACNASEQCKSGRCLKTAQNGSAQCVPRIADGEPCTYHADCASGACSPTEPHVCGALLANGQPCQSSHAACASGFCNSVADGVAALCAPPPTRRRGESCSAASDCITDPPNGFRDLCQNGQCVSDICAAYAQ